MSVLLFLGFLFCMVMSIPFVSCGNITVTWTGGHYCTLEFLHRKMPCSLGKNGATLEKKEGDGKTPIGIFPLRRAFFRADKVPVLQQSEQRKVWCYDTASYLHCEAIEVNFGWVDESMDPMYNQFVFLPYPQNSNSSVSHENLYLTDSSVYDLFAVIGYNDAPVIPFLGSAIFFHIASMVSSNNKNDTVASDFGPTAGCVALAKEDLIFVLSQVEPQTMFIIQDGTEQQP